MYIFINLVLFIGEGPVRMTWDFLDALSSFDGEVLYPSGFGIELCFKGKSLLKVNRIQKNSA